MIEMKKILFLVLPLVIMAISCKPKQMLTPVDNDEIVEEVVDVDTPTDAEPDDEIQYNEFGMPILLEYTPTMIDLGEVVRGEKKALAFQYKNISKEIVEIEVVTACSCTETDYTVTKMNPGESGQINLLFDSTSKEKSETIDVDIILKNTDPKNGYPIVDRIQFKYDLITEDR